jgi:hypothetical protein
MRNGGRGDKESSVGEEGDRENALEIYKKRPPPFTSYGGEKGGTKGG